MRLLPARTPWLLALGACLSLVAGTALAAPARGAPATADTANAVVTDGNARFQVLTPTLIRLEYAGDRSFQDATTFNAVNRAFPETPFTTTVTADGFREIRTAALTLRYRQGSGPFTRANLTVTGAGITAAPAFPSYCVVSTACEAENSLLVGKASTAYDHTGSTGSGFVAGFEKVGSGITTSVSGVPAAGSYRLAIRYANATGGDGQNTTRTVSTRINGTAGPRLTLAPTGSWDTWATVGATANLTAGTNKVEILYRDGDSGRINVDSLAVTPTSTTSYPAPETGLMSTGYGAGPASTLGGWSRSLDNPAQVPAYQHPGVLNRDGWYLLDDTRSALLSADHKVGARPDHGTNPYQDGYFFGYGRDYKRALGDLNALTGGTNLLPQSAYGVWYSRYHAYTTADYQNTLLPKFRSTFVPLDWLVVDTDYKSPNTWNGWNWNPALFPNPQAFMDWTRQQGLSVSLNVHPTIAEGDPKYAETNATAGGLEADTSAWTQVGPHLFDWSKPAQLTAYLNLHKPFEQQGVRAWWLDYCSFCGASTASDPQVAPDNLINQAYADNAAGRGLRGFSFARIGGAEYGGITSSYPIGPWSERRNTLQFTGDTPGTWDFLRYAVRYTADESAAGLSNVSHDIGSFHGDHLPDDQYARWVQFGTFQPIDRLHSDHADRLPWEYGAEAGDSAARFLRLREALVPYTYTMAKQANTTGVPIVRPMYLEYPATDAAYNVPGQYLYGDNLLVAPITTPNSGGVGSASVWVPPGSWTDYFTGQTYTGPATVTISAPLSRMPVLMKAGGIVATRTDYVDNQVERVLTRLTANVAAGANGAFTLYQDAGEGTGSSATTPLSWNDGARTLTVGATAGSYPGAVTARAYTLRLSNSSAPTAVQVDGRQVPETAWSYNRDNRTVTVTTDSLPVASAHTITLTGSANANPTTGVTVGPGGLCLDVRDGVAAEGQPVQLYTCNFSAAQQVAYQSDNTVRVLGRCLTPSGSGNGSTIATATCTGASAQTWTRHINGTLVNGSGRCLDVPSGNTTPGAVQLQLSDCGTAAAQVWRLPPGPMTVSGGLCADVAGADPASATAVQLFACNASDAQRWYTPGDQTVRVFGKCLDVSRAGTGNGTPVQLYDCNGTPAQSWISRADGSLLNPNSGRCLDDRDGLLRSGDRLQLYDCNGTPAQHFRLG
ncbi:TIM-barrel domain-containing protein [Kribbella sp. NPDC051587]|uniref:TIM-barrel domain-containing protein n=1 Tax=Kribbella sp. NPDC051587 TaxID=3364119 RepID=UPI0037ABCBAE